MTPAIVNLHNHTPFSDGAYTIDEICEAHLKLSGAPVAAIGICDHLFVTPSSRSVTSIKEFDRLFGDEARRYIEAVKAAKQRWAGKLTIYCGAEINWPLNRQMLDHLRTRLEGVDYVLFEFLDWAGLTQLANQARRFPCSVGLAHTDVDRQFATTPHEQVVRTLANARIFYEINTKLMPLSKHAAWFHTLAQHKVFVSLGTDTHDDLSCLKTLPKLHEFAVQNGLGEKFVVPRAKEPKEAVTNGAPVASATQPTADAAIVRSE